MNMKVSDEVTSSRNNQPNNEQERQPKSINYSKRTREDISTNSKEAKRIKEEPIDIQIQESNSHIESTSKEVEVKAEVKFSATEEFANKTSIQSVSIAFLNEETTQATTSSDNHPTTSTIHKLASDKKPYQCNSCKKSFTLKSNLEVHRRTHTGERPYKCEICEKRFTQLNVLKNHKVIHTGEKPFKCEICKKNFSRSDVLMNHKKTHTGEKPYECEICKKRFSLLCNLVTHQRTHTGERPYKCEICEKNFTRSSTLASHKRTHTGEKIVQM